MITETPYRQNKRHLARKPLAQDCRTPAPLRSCHTFMAMGLASIALLSWASTALTAPRIACDAATYDFGTIQSNKQSLEHVFTLKNTGDATLHIANVKTSCGCTTGEIENKILEPGGQTSIKSTFNPSGRKGPQHKTITIQSDDPTSPDYNLELKCDIKPALDVEPSSLFLKEVYCASTNQVTTLLQCASNYTFRILSVDTGQLKQFTIQLDTLETGRIYSITARLVLGEKTTNGFIREHVTLKTDMPGYESLTIPILAHVVEEVALRPSVIVVNQQSLSREPLRIDLFLQSDKARKWSMTAVDAEGDLVVTTDSMQADRATIAITGLKQLASLPDKRIRVHVRSANGAERTLTVPFQYASPRASKSP